MDDVKIDLSKVKSIHFIGIGGSGMCPMAQILKSFGYEITGSDNYISDTLEGLMKNGAKIYLEHKKENVAGADLVVYSAAIKEDNPEMIAAKEMKIPCLERSIMLGLLCDKYKNLIAVSGTHGKTTTTAMITQTLINGLVDPSAIIGGKLPMIGGNSKIGKSETIVCEACEYVDSFLQLHPAISIITNVDADHLDYFKTLDNIVKSFNKFANQTTKLLIVNGDDKNSMRAVEGVKVPILKFGLGNHNDYYADEIKKFNGAFDKFTVYKNRQKLIEVELSVPGEHNIYNALAAVVVADFMGVDLDVISRSLHEFLGVHRRFEVLGTPKGITVADDFAHHPTEIRATLTAAKDMGFKKVWAVFQPHTYSRTQAFLNEFAKALSIADEAIVSEILAVREENVYNVYAEDLVSKVKRGTCIHTFEGITDYIEKNAKSGDLVLTMGGGNVYRCANMILNRLEGRN